MKEKFKLKNNLPGTYRVLVIGHADKYALDCTFKIAHTQHHAQKVVHAHMSPTALKTPRTLKTTHIIRVCVYMHTVIHLSYLHARVTVGQPA